MNSAFTVHIQSLRLKPSRAIVDLLFDLIAATPALTCCARGAPDTLTL
ncbi:MAG: hypothetical protein VX766_02130 [Pseudomonadota bacterium]|nr:hypothetical protein [Pseudomonadota bacterium]